MCTNSNQHFVAVSAYEHTIMFLKQRKLVPTSVSVFASFHVRPLDKTVRKISLLLQCVQNKRQTEILALI